MADRKIYVKRKRTGGKDHASFLLNRIEEWVSYWRENPHRFITEYLGLRFKGDFQSVLFYAMDMYTHFIYVASRGLG